MKIQLETIRENEGRSFSTMINPRMNDLFFWHFHPEYELVYLTGADGTRHVGDHISEYTNSDLVLIGSGIPHLNFDYGIKTDYDKVVVHLKKEFVEQHLQRLPELSSLAELFKKSSRGIAFKGPGKDQIGQQIFDLDGLAQEQQYMSLLQILHALSGIQAYEFLHDQPYTQRYSQRDQGRLRTIYAFVDKNYQRKISLEEVASLSNLSKEAFCRYFKKASNYTFVEFLNRYRISQSKRFLMSGKSVSDACYSCGFESLSYYHRIFKRITQEKPSEFKKRYLAGPS